MSTLVQDAKALATKAHQGQTDRQGQAYIGHPERVAAKVALLGEGAQAVAWLHDVLEDTIYLPADLQRFPEAVRDAVCLLTRPKDMPYASYIELLGASGNPLAITVKLADLADNLDPARASGLTEGLERRYHAAVASLQAWLGRHHAYRARTGQVPSA